MQRPVLTLLAALALLTAATPRAARAASVGVNFGDGSGAYDTLATTASAGVAPYAQTNFNNVTISTATALKDNSGIATSVQLTLTGTSFGYLSNATIGPDEVLNDGIAVTTGSQSFTLTGIPYANYILVVYGLNSASGSTQSIAAGGTTYYLSSPNPLAVGYIDDNAATAFTYKQATSTNAAVPTANSDYVVFTGLSGASQTITDTKISGNFGLIGGFQIIQVPEPSAWAMLGLGVAGAGFAALRRRVRAA